MAQRKRRAKVQSATKTSANEIEKKLEEFQHELVQTSLFPEYGDGEMTLSEEQQRKNEQGKRLKSLKKAEDILDDILSEKKSSWVAVYTVLKNVQRYELFTGEGYSSFTAWVRAYAKKSAVSTQTLWKYHKSGHYFEEIQNDIEKQGKKLDVDPSALSPDGVAIISRMARNNSREGAALMKKLADGELPRGKLTQLWRAKRAALEARGGKAVMVNGYDARKCAGMEMAADPEESPMTAPDIVHALQNTDWLPERVTEHRPPYVKEQYLCMTEFPVRITVTRRVDVLIAENLTIPSDDADYKLWLHGVEIKTSASDLKQDLKMEEYALFVDRMWIAIPDGVPDLRETAEARIDENPGWGLLVIQADSSVEVVIPADGEVMKDANSHSGALRINTLMTLVHRLRM